MTPLSKTIRWIKHASAAEIRAAYAELEPARCPECVDLRAQLRERDRRIAKARRLLRTWFETGDLRHVALANALAAPRKGKR